MAASDTPNALERTVAVVGVLLTLAVVGVLVGDALNDGDPAPRLHVALGAPEAAAGGVRVPVRVRNDGGQTAEDVTVEVCRGDGPDAACAETTFPYVPRGSSRDGAVGFDGVGGALRARVASYQRP